MLMGWDTTAESQPIERPTSSRLVGAFLLLFREMLYWMDKAEVLVELAMNGGSY